MNIALHYLALLLALPFVSCGQPGTVEEKKVFYTVGDSKVVVGITHYPGEGSAVFIHLHANEKSSLQTAIPFLQEKGGLLVRIINNEKRLVTFTLNNRPYSFDPNRMFSVEGIRQSLARNGSANDKAVESVYRFARALLELVPGNRTLIVALHNNTEGRLSVHSYQAGGEHADDVADVIVSPDRDPDDFVLTTDAAIYKHLEGRFNTVLQNNAAARADGSLSVYCGEKGIPYVNCETQEGHSSELSEMLHALLPFIAPARN